MRWADQFCNEAKAKDIDCSVINRVNGWPETIVVYGKKCFAKSVTYSPDRDLYFIGIDPKKLEERGDFVLICGGINSSLKDIFIVPWKDFFQILKQGEPINTYRQPREYWQYKFKMKNYGGKWHMAVQGGSKPEINVGKWRYNPDEAIKFLSRVPNNFYQRDHL